MLWFLLRLLSLMMTILPILFLYRSEETDEQKEN
jgi:hypothetical protein